MTAAEFAQTCTLIIAIIKAAVCFAGVLAVLGVEWARILRFAVQA